MNLFTEIMGHHSIKTGVPIDELKHAVRMVALNPLPKLEAGELRIDLNHTSAYLMQYGAGGTVIADTEYSRLVSILDAARRTMRERARTQPTTAKVIGCMRQSQESIF